MNRVLTVDVRKLAYCRACYEPMYCIYDQSIRDFCHECALEMKAEEAEHLHAAE